MLIYNHKKEFIGISDKDLRHFKLSSLAELQTEVTDFADLFVKVPGYIHNFKHVHWLDFISSADSIDENKVIISVKGKNYKAILKLQTLYLIDEPAQGGYGIELSNIRELTAEENEQISGELAQRSIEKATAVTPPVVEQTQTEEETEEFVSFQNENDLIEDPYANKLDVEETLDIDMDDLYEEESPTPPPVQPTTPLQTVTYEEDDKFKDYVYDPEVASNDLGLPVDLVEEFIQDFIAQAKEFKEEMYRSLEEGDIDTLKSTSHKLKGVAANLRIEDAYDALVIINTSDDMDKVKQNMDKFYNIIIKKLAGETPIATQTIAEDLSENEDAENISLDLDLPQEEELQEEMPKENKSEEDDLLDLDLDLF
ncbi:MAG: Hpt domain-containing protein, partial [Epsilonproteobacteria bacterium]|nr:Hpt domain-containing protein [Campylobacterota bacterium]